MGPRNVKAETCNPSLSFSPTSPTVGDTVTFIPAVCGTVDHVDWNFGDNIHVTEFDASTSVTHAYQAAGSYIVVLTITDASGNLSVTSLTVNVAGIRISPSFVSSVGHGYDEWWRKNVYFSYFKLNVSFHEQQLGQDHPEYVEPTLTFTSPPGTWFGPASSIPTYTINGDRVRPGESFNLKTSILMEAIGSVLDEVTIPGAGTAFGLIVDHLKGTEFEQHPFEDDQEAAVLKNPDKPLNWNIALQSDLVPSDYLILVVMLKSFDNNFASKAVNVLVQATYSYKEDNGHIVNNPVSQSGTVVIGSGQPQETDGFVNFSSAVCSPSECPIGNGLGPGMRVSVSSVSPVGLDGDGRFSYFLLHTVYILPGDCWPRQEDQPSDYPGYQPDGSAFPGFVAYGCGSNFIGNKMKITIPGGDTHCSPTNVKDCSVIDQDVTGFYFYDNEGQVTIGNEILKLGIGGAFTLVSGGNPIVGILAGVISGVIIDYEFQEVQKKCQSGDCSAALAVEYDLNVVMHACCPYSDEYNMIVLVKYPSAIVHPQIEGVVGTTFECAQSTIHPHCPSYGLEEQDRSISFIITSNRAPLAVPGPDRTIEGNSKGGAVVQLDGSSSSDPDGDPLTFSWNGDFGAATEVAPSVFLGLGTHQIRLVVNDGQKNSAPALVNITVVDTTPATITAHREPPPNAYDWTNQTVTVGFDCSDIVWNVPAPQQVILPNEGKGQTATGTCTDGSGNTASKTLGDINIDKTPPYPDPDRPCTVMPPANEHGWRNSDVNVECTFKDGLSGIPDDIVCVQVVGVVCPGPVIHTSVGTEGRDQSVTLCTYDRAGNKGCTTVGGINIDKTPPVIMSPQDGQAFILLQSVLTNATCTDSLSGMDTCLVPAFVDTTTVGAHSYVVTSTDLAGNSATFTVHYNVHYVFVTVSPKPPNNRFQVGSTIPVRFQLKDALGTFVSTATARIWVDSPANPGKCSGSSNTGNYFRYDSTDSQYIFNLSTKGMTVGQHTVYITLDDGTVHSFLVTLSS